MVNRLFTEKLNFEEIAAVGKTDNLLLVCDEEKVGDSFEKPNIYIPSEYTIAICEDKLCIFSKQKQAVHLVPKDWINEIYIIY